MRTSHNKLNGNNETLSQIRFSHTCSMIIDHVIDPLCTTLLDDIQIPNPETAMFFHEIKIDPIQRMTDALLDILEHKDADREEVTKLLHASMAKEAATIEETENENNKIELYWLLQMLKNILCNARDCKTFIEFDKVYINTPFRLGKFVAGLLIGKQKYLPEDMPIFKNLEEIVDSARSINSRGI